MNSSPKYTVHLALLCVLSGCGAAQPSSPRAARGRGASVAERGVSPADPHSKRAADSAPAPTTQAQGEGHLVKLSAPSKVGDTFKIQAKVTKMVRFKMAFAGKDKDSAKETTLEVASIHKVTQVDAEGRVMESEYLLERCVGGVDGAVDEVLPPGTTLTVRRHGPQPRLSASSGELSKQTLETLKVFFHTSDHMATDDELFGSPNPQTVGSEWGLNLEALAAYFDALNIKFDVGDFSGSTRLLSAAPCGSTTCLRTETRMQAANGRSKRRIPAMTHSEVSFSGVSARSLPTDAHGGPGRLDEQLTIRMVFTFERNGQEGELASEISVHEKIQWQPLAARGSP